MNKFFVIVLGFALTNFTLAYVGGGGTAPGNPAVLPVNPVAPPVLPVNPVDPPVSPVNPVDPPVSAGGTKGGGSSLVPWGAGCKANHVGHYGTRTVTCPFGWCQDDSTCGCTPCGSLPVCALCKPTTCSTGTTCETPSGCQSIICVSTAMAALPIDLMRFNTLGLEHGGAVICGVESGATLSNLEDKLKDQSCRQIYKSLIKFKELYP